MADTDIIEVSADGRVTEMIWDPLDRKVHIGTRHDVAPLLDDNMRMQNNGPGWLGPSREMKLVARLNMETVTNLMRAGIWADRKRFRKWLNDGDVSKLRTDRCRL